MRKSTALPILAFFLPSLAGAQILPEPPSVDTLPNGLRLVTVRWPSPGIVAYFTLVRVGSRDEVEPGKSGFAHLFEHMMFRGTERYPSERYERIIQEMGADNNAFTTSDFTLYTVTTPGQSLPRLVELEADRFAHLSYSEQAFQTETRAVLGEYNKSASSPDLQMWEALSELAFTRHTYGHTTMGYLRDIQRMPGSYSFSVQFLRRYYTPDNCTIFAVGDVDRDELLRLVSERYAGWTGRRDTPQIPLEPEQAEERSRHLSWQSATPPKILMGYRVPPFSTANVDTAALRVLYELAFGPSSDLYQRLVVAEQKLLSLGENGMDLNRDPGLLVVDAELREGTRFDEITGAVTEELSRIAAGQIPAARIEEVKSHVRYGMQLDLETPDDVAVLLAYYAAMDGDVLAVDRFMTQLGEVGPADVARVAREYLTPTRRTTVTLATGVTR
ncbi:MAG: insulinase family protein [Deltaproteobacteria bacterium]|nr:insulinase family protein [Deltaproteobacteria bacterium]